MQVLLRCLILMCLVAVSLPARAIDITAVRSWRAPDNTRLVLDLNAPVLWRVSPDSTPARLIIDLVDAAPAGPIALPQVSTPLKAVRLEKSAQGQRLVIDTLEEMTPKIFQLAPNEKYSQRLVIDLYSKVTTTAVIPATTTTGTANAAAEAILTAVKPPSVITSIPVMRPTELTAPIISKPDEKPIVMMEKPESRRWRNIIVAIDAGHGGEDPGAIGAKGSHEKHVTLAIARELEAMLKAEPGLTAVLTRTGDYFIPLQERRRIARYQHKADIFISVHADAAENRSAKGASVFALSLKGAGTATSRFARMLAERENRSDLIGGAAIEAGDDTLRNVLADMVVAGSLDHSLHMGRNILDRFTGLTHLHSKHVEQAGFAVLKEPGMVSLLVETGFISNPEEEEKLTDKQHQRDLAKAIFEGVLRYNQRYPAPGSYFAWQADERSNSQAAVASRSNKKPNSNTDASHTEARTANPAASVNISDEKLIRYRIVPGDSLSRIASRHQVSMNDLRRYNNLTDDTVKIGQTLNIPVN
ncbi:MAG: N-acetylmuramoyl-L-alanine amidase [Moraxellaceae bacterium]|nr:N-acetylmuramoyl-L-alanine amidase [Moraxellaceae bacterium]